MATTRLGQLGVGVQPYGTFQPKTAAPDTDPHNPGVITRLGQFGIGLAKYGTFQPKAEAEVTEPPVQEDSGRGGGAGFGRRPELVFTVTINGETFYFDSYEEALLALQKGEPFGEIEERAERDAKRIVRLGRAKARPKPPAVKVTGPIEFRSDLRELQRKIDRIYWRALAEAVAQIAEEEEDILFIASIDD